MLPEIDLVTDEDTISNIFFFLETSSGIQVITLGVLLGNLIIVFYGLSFFCSIRREKHQPKTEIKE